MALTVWSNCTTRGTTLCTTTTTNVKGRCSSTTFPSTRCSSTTRTRSWPVSIPRGWLMCGTWKMGNCCGKYKRKPLWTLFAGALTLPTCSLVIRIWLNSTVSEAAMSSNSTNAPTQSSSPQYSSLKLTSIVYQWTVLSQSSIMPLPNLSPHYKLSKILSPLLESITITPHGSSHDSV